MIGIAFAYCLDDRLFSGKIDLVAILRVHTPQELDAALDRIGELDGVRDTDSNIVLSTKFDRR